MTMTAKRRALVTAILTTIAACGFAFSLAALGMGAETAINDGGTTEGVTYTFETYRCVGTSSQYQHCGWLGTVTSNGVVEAKNVEFRSNTSPTVSAGEQVQALWSYRDPLNAWNIEGSRAWLNTIASAIVSFVLLAIMLLLAIYWWRRFARDGLSKSQQAKLPKATEEHAQEKESVSG